MNSKITDEQILSYLMGDADHETTSLINQEVEKDPDFIKKIGVIGQIQKQVKLAPTECYVPVKNTSMMWKLAPTCCLILMSFAIGLYVESKFLVIGPKDLVDSAVYMDKEISTPLSWDENKSNAIL